MLQLAQNGRVDHQAAMILKRSRQEMFQKSDALRAFQLQSGALIGMSITAIMFSFLLFG